MKMSEECPLNFMNSLALMRFLDTYFTMARFHYLYAMYSFMHTFVIQNLNIESFVAFCS